jgi:alkylation response protein AidB-like acyl-CoA dehydrogenase
MATAGASDVVLPEQMLAGFAHRCGDYDRENRFFEEDFRDLKEAGYLTVAAPREFGGHLRHVGAR